MQAFTARDLRCGGAEAVLVLPSGAVGAATLAAAPLPADARSPLPSLRARIVLDQASSALELFVAPSAADRLDAIGRLSRRMNDLPPDLPKAALQQERNPEVIAALKAMAVESGLHSPDVSRRLAAIQIMGDNARARTEAELGTLRPDPAYAKDPRIAAALDQSLASVRLVDAAMPHLEASDVASIVIISSVSGREIDFAAGPYGAFKAALIHYAQGLAYQLAGRGIRANTVSSGNTYFPGGVWQKIERDNPALFETAMALNPTGRMGKPEEAARAAAFLASPAASFITGANLVVDGALTRGVQF